MRVSENLSSDVSNPLPLLHAHTQQQHAHSRAAVAATVIAVVDIVDPEPDREHRVLARPRRRRGFPPPELVLELLHLLDEVERVERRLHQLRVDRRSRCRVVVRQDERLVELDRDEVDPVRADARRARVVGVAERVAGGGLRAPVVEPAGGVRITAAFQDGIGECLGRYRSGG